MHHRGLCVVVYRPGQTEAGLLLHRHLLSQQHLRVCVLLLLARVTVCSLPLLPAEDEGNKVVFLAPSSRKKKKKKKKRTQNKSQLWLFPLCHTAASKPVKQPTLPVHFHPSEREEMETGCHGYRQSPIVTLFICNTLSGGTLQRLQKKDPLFCASNCISCNPLLQCNYM